MAPAGGHTTPDGVGSGTERGLPSLAPLLAAPAARHGTQAGPPWEQSAAWALSLFSKGQRGRKPAAGVWLLGGHNAQL